jgi:chaperonin GroEL (HSP60 family)
MKITHDEKLVDGLVADQIHEVVQIIKKTYGPNGKNVIFPTTQYPNYILTNDAKTIINNFFGENEDLLSKELVGATILRELVNRIDKISGDGRKTTMILLDDMLNRPDGYSEDQLERDIAKIQELTVPADEVLESVALSACQNHRITKQIMEASSVVGKDGFITIEGSLTKNPSVQTVTGATILDTTYQHPAFRSATDTFENPLIVVSKTPLASIDDFEKLLRLSKGRSLVVVAEGYDDRFLDTMIRTKLVKNLELCFLKPPVAFADFAYDDFAEITGADIYNEKLKLPSYDFGTCEKIVVEDRCVRIIGGKQLEPKDVGVFTEERNKNISSTNAIITLQSGTDTDLYYKTLKARDGVAAVALAKQGGAIEGAGVTLQKIGFDTVYSLVPHDKTFYDPSLLLQNSLKMAYEIYETVRSIGVVITKK